MATCENKPQSVDRCSDDVKTADAEILRDLARAKAVFQLRAIEAIIKGGA